VTISAVVWGSRWKFEL